MPTKPKRPCGHPGCRELTTERLCEPHAKAVRQATDQRRGTAHERGYDHEWRRTSKQFLRANPLCRHCEQEGFVRAAKVTDHVIPHKGDKVLFWDRNNWQPLCKKHHDRKTVKEDGGFGR